MSSTDVFNSPVKVTVRYEQKGERGIGISSIALDDQAHLIITYDDGSTQDAGAVLGDVTSIKNGIDSTYKKIQTSEANVTKLESFTRANAEKAKQALQDTQSTNASGVDTINALVTEKMTYMTSTFNNLLTQAKANIDQWERDAEDKIHTERTYSLDKIKTAHDDAMVDIERSVNKAEAWAVSETTPDKEPDFESPTGLTQSSRSWALLSKKKVQEAYDTLKDIKDNETNVSNMKNDVTELLHKAQTSEQNTHDYMDAASASQRAAKESEQTAATHMENAKTSEVNAKASETASADSASKAHTSELNAKSSETKSASSASSASTSASNAKTSETNAKASETNASSSATTAKNWAVATTSPDGATDTDSNTGKTQSSRSWALASKASAESASTSASNAAKAEIAAKTAQAAAEMARDDANTALNKLTGAMKYAGQVDNYSDLESYTKNKGDVWNIVNADPAHGIKAGDNVAWNGTDWDDLSGTVDLSIYAEKADYQKTITSATADGATITFNHKDGTTSTTMVNNVASATAAANDAKGQRIDTTYEKVTDASDVHTSLQNSINSLSTSKQDKLTFDLTPTADSSNPVTSSGIKTALDGKPSNTGAGASGTWGINITGNANTATKATQDSLGNTIKDTYVKKAGDTITGPILYSKTPSNDSELINKAYADKLSNAVPLKKYTLDLSTLDINTFYPVVFDEHMKSIEAEIHSRGDTATYAYSQNMLSFEAFASGWNDGEHKCTIKNYFVYDEDEITIGCLALGSTFGGACVWLRGGTPSPYIIISTVTPQLYENGWSESSGQVATVGPTYHGADTGNTNINIVFNPLDIPSGSAKNLNYTTYGTFEKAIKDADGNVISDTYLKKAGDTVTGTLNVPTQATTDNSTKVANTAFVQSAVSQLVNSAPETLDTLNELSNALGNDPNFATTVTNMIGQKLDKTGTGATGTWGINISGTAAKATSDASGNNIANTYAKKTDTYTKTEVDSKLSESSKILEKVYPVGSIYMNATDSRNPAEIFGFGTWAQISAGRVLLGAGTADSGTTYNAGDTGGEEKHTLTTSELPVTNVTVSGTTNAAGNHRHSISTMSSESSESSPQPAYGDGSSKTGYTNYDGNHVHLFTGSGTFGGGESHNVMQPFLVVYIFKRTA